MTLYAGKDIICPNCGEETRATWDYETYEIFLVGKRGKQPVCEACQQPINIEEQDDSWVPLD